MRWTCALVIAACGCDHVFGVGAGQVSDGNAAIVDGTPGIDGRDAPPPTPDALPPPPDASTSCPPSYTGIAGEPTHYRFALGPVTWAQAQLACLGDQVPGSLKQTHLVVMDDDAERGRVGTMSTGFTWIGLSDRAAESIFQWVSTEPTSYPPVSGPWETGQPDDGFGGPSQDCVWMQANDNFDDFGCDGLAAFVCECDAFPNDPSHYTPL